MPEGTISQRLVHTTNEDIKSALSQAQRFEWAFRIVLGGLIGLLCWVGKSLADDVKALPVNFAGQMLAMNERLQKLEIKEQQDIASTVKTDTWTPYHASFESRLALEESKTAVLISKIDSFAESQRRTSSAIESLDQKFTGFQIDFNAARARNK